MTLIPVDVGLTFSNRTQEGEQKLQRKGCGRLIHVSDFIKEENRCLIIHNKDGDVVKDTHCIIYLGVGGNPWWNMCNSSCKLTKQL